MSVIVMSKIKPLTDRCTRSGFWWTTQNFMWQLIFRVLSDW